jgi:hypothetical protein
MDRKILAFICCLLMTIFLQAGCGKSRLKPADKALLAEGNFEGVKEWLKKGGNVNAVDKNGWTTLHIAAPLKSKDIAALLIEKGANINAANKAGWTPLHIAAAFGRNDEVAALLIEKGANINAVDKHGDTPLHVAASHGCKDVVALLIAKNANINAVDDRGDTPLRKAEKGLRGRGRTDIAELLRRGATQSPPAAAH